MKSEDRAAARMRLRPPFVFAFLLLAGCVGQGGHGAGGEGPRLLAGVVAEGAEPIDVELLLFDSNATLAWNASFAVAPGGTMERVTPLYAEGAHLLELRLAGADEALASAAVDTGDCRGTLHLVFTLSPGGAATESTRECHE